MIRVRQHTSILANPVQQQIAERLRLLPAACAPIVEHAARYTRYCSSIATGETLQIGHAPWVAPEAYAFRLFPVAKKAWFQRFREDTGRPIPSGYRDFLLGANGCSAYGLSLYGLPPSLQRDPPVLDRARPQPLDLGAANRHWAREYQGSGGAFHFGGRAWSREENVGYFWAEGGLRSLRRGGEVAGEWPDLPALLAEELAAAERLQAERTPAEWWH